MAPNGDFHRTESFYGCAYCTEAYPDAKELQVHIKMVHEGKPFSSKPAPLPAKEQRLLTQTPAAAISKSIPLSEVNRHITPHDCWVALNGKVYDLSEFMDRHPGGPTTILAWAGKDASKFFNDIHKGVKIDAYLRPESYLGTLGVDENLMSDGFWHTLREARIVEVREEIDRVLSTGGTHKADSIQRLMQDKHLDPALKTKINRLETQKRAALDAEDYHRATDIKRQIEEVLSHDEHAHLHEVPLKADWSSKIPLSEVARHNKPHDLWIAINQVVYDLTEFLIHHPEQRNSILAWAGRDATPMWDKIPGRFPSKQWMEFYMRPEACMGEVGEEPALDPQIEQLKKLHDELRRLEGPSKEDIAAVKTAVNVPGKTDVPTLSEEARFPKLAEISAGKELPFFSRAEVAKHTSEEPYMIIHNRVYNLKPLLGSHPGGDDILLSKAGTDCTKDFEVFEHSEKARVQRDRDLLIGHVVPAEQTDWAAETNVSQVVGEESSELGRYIKYKVTDAAAIAACWYVYKTLQNTKPLSQFTYSRGLRHLHLLMACGIFGAVGTAQAAAYSSGQAKKQLLWWHKQTGIAMLLALVVRFFLRLKSGIPPRFPGHPLVQMIETQSLKAFYLLALLLPLSGIANEYFLKWAPGSDKTGKAEDDKRNDQMAKMAMDSHKLLGKFLQYTWLPFHLGYTTLYHWSQGRGVVRKVSPFV
ncbi:unnamed protein product [Effrenium voratum]|uniref:Cytochrome b5 heme-binding domain-containing protein n=1 Tax=Effrenium voratum TaxID=2562239 RepID=A0AA36HXA5_9DINO|nr:unnamed protein product [Effrenium voratum]